MLPKLYLLSVVLALASGQEWTLVWSDEFDGDEIDLEKWQHEITAWGGGVSTDITSFRRVSS